MRAASERVPPALCLRMHAHFSLSRLGLVNWIHKLHCEGFDTQDTNFGGNANEQHFQQQATKPSHRVINPFKCFLATKRSFVIVSNSAEATAWTPSLDAAAKKVASCITAAGEFQATDVRCALA